MQAFKREEKSDTKAVNFAAETKHESSTKPKNRSDRGHKRSKDVDGGSPHAHFPQRTNSTNMLEGETKLPVLLALPAQYLFLLSRSDNVRQSLQDRQFA